MTGRTAFQKAPFKAKEDFYAELQKLRQRFDTMKPAVATTLYDEVEDVEGFVVVWNTKISENGPLPLCGKGGTRIKKGLTLDEIKRLARSMAEKNAAAGLPLGGAKSGLNADPESPDYERKFRAFVRMVRKAGLLRRDGNANGVFGGFGYDIGGKPPLNAIWACDELGSGNWFTGKPVEMGGTDYDREGIAGLGVAVAARTLLEIRAKSVSGASFAVQGVGAMGSAVVRYFSEYGGMLKSLSDPKYGGTWLFDKGASEPLVKALAANDAEAAKGLLPECGIKISDNSQDVLYQDVDVLFPCALEDSITKDNAKKIKAPFISEGANNPTSEEAHRILFANGTIVIPDIIANPGGIIAAFVELSSKVTPEENAKTRAKVKEAKDMTIKRVAANVHALLTIVDELGVEPDQVGDYLAYRNIFYGIPDAK